MNDIVTVDRRVWLDADGHAVEDGDPAAATLLAGSAGDEITAAQAAAANYVPRDDAPDDDAPDDEAPAGPAPADVAGGTKQKSAARNKAVPAPDANKTAPAAGDPPPRGGGGSGVDAWVDWANEVAPGEPWEDIAEADGRDDGVIARLVELGVIDDED